MTCFLVRCIYEYPVAVTFRLTPGKPATKVKACSPNSISLWLHSSSRALKRHTVPIHQSDTISDNTETLSERVCLQSIDVLRGRRFSQCFPAGDCMKSTDHGTHVNICWFIIGQVRTDLTQMIDILRPSHVSVDLCGINC